MRLSAIASTPRLRAHAYVALAAAVLALAFALRLPSLFEPRWYADEGIFASIAQNMREGRTLYAEAWDNKPPLILVTYALVQAAFGTGVMPLHAVTAIVVLGTAVAVMAIARRLYGRPQSLAAGALFALVMCTPVIEGNLALTETYMVLPATLGVMAFVAAQDRAAEGRGAWYATAGVLMSIAIAYKQVAAFDALALATFIWLTQERPARALAPFAAGVVVPQLALLALFASLGALGAYWYAIVGSLVVYAELSDDKGPLLRVAGYVPALLVVAYLVRQQRLGGAVSLQHLPMLWFAFAFAGATSSPFEFPHYLQQIVPAGALVVVSNPVPLERDGLGRVTLAAAGALIAAMIFGQYTAVFGEHEQLRPVRYYETFVSRERGEMDELDYMYRFDGSAVAVKDIVAYIDADRAGTTLFTWSELSWLYAAAGMTNPTRYYASFLGEVVPDAKEEIIADLQAAPPAYVVISDSAYAPFLELERFVEGRYDLLRAQGDWRLYRLSSATGRLTPIAAAGEARS